MLTLSDVKNNSKVSPEERQKRVLACKGRPNPRHYMNMRKRKKFKGDMRVGSGRLSLAYILWLTREEIINCSQEIFGELCAEDLRREILLNAEGHVLDISEEIEEISALSNVTIRNIEDALGSEGAKPATLKMIAGRIYNPLTQKAFTPVELHFLTQDMLEGWEWGKSNLGDLNRFCSEIDRINRERDEELFYYRK